MHLAGSTRARSQADRACRLRCRIPSAPCCSGRPDSRTPGALPDCPARSASSSSRVNGLRSSVNCAVAQPPMLKTHPPGPTDFARARSISIACSRESIPSHRSSSSHVLPARRRCRWLSISPGMAVRPLRSIVLVPGPASLAISWVEPTATMRSPLTATAWAIVKRSSTVTILPFENTRSAAVPAAESCAGGRAQHLKCAGGHTQRNRDRTSRSLSCHRPRSEVRVKPDAVPASIAAVPDWPHRRGSVRVEPGPRRGTIMRAVPREGKISFDHSKPVPATGRRAAATMAWRACLRDHAPAG